MLSLGQARRLRGATGDPLPSPYRAFDEYEIQFRRGMFVMLVAGSGTGKSTLGLNLALRMNVPTLYLSADSGSFTQVARSYQIAKGVSKHRAERYALGQDDPLADDLREFHIRWSFAASPTEDDVQEQMEAFEELYGSYPHLTIVDNISNVLTAATDRPNTGLENIGDFLLDTARQTQSCVLAMHHANGPWAAGTEPIPLNGIKDQPHRTPEMILTAFRPSETTIGVSPVKNRDARRDPTGQWYAELAFDTGTMQMTDIT